MLIDKIEYVILNKWTWFQASYVYTFSHVFAVLSYSQFSKLNILSHFNRVLTSKLFPLLAPWLLRIIFNIYATEENQTFGN